MSKPRLLWFVQTNLHPEPQEELLAAIDQHARLETFAAVPFQMEPPPLPAGFCFPMGTCNIIERIRSVRPEIVQGGLFDYRDYLRHFGALCLNDDAWTGRLAEFCPAPSDFPFFLRPTHDDKSFAGELWEDFARFTSWKDAIIAGTTIIPADCLVVAASPKNILEEWRLIVVHEEVVTFSRYRKHGRMNRDRVDLPADVAALARDVIACWRPATIFALDVAVTAHGARLIELGSIHSCGLYACDRDAFVRAVSAALS
jgi:hypothetical protein